MQSIFFLVVKRLVSQRSLALASLLGMVGAVTIVTSIPLYVDAVFGRVLREELTGEALDTGRSPFTFVFHYSGALTGPVPWDDVRAADTYLSGAVLTDLGLPLRSLERFLRTERFLLFPRGIGSYQDAQSALAAIRFGSISEVRQHMTITEGRFPAVAPLPQQGVVEVMMSASLAEKTGIQVGELFVAFQSGELGNTQIPVLVAGIWRATEPSDPYWFRDPDSLSDVLLVPTETFLGRLSSQLRNEVDEALWYLVADGSGLVNRDVEALIRRVARVQVKASSLLPESANVTTPLTVLQRHQRSARLLTILLFSFSVPVIGLNLVFVGLVMDMSVERRRNEISMLLSRGATRRQIVGVAAMEGFLTGLLALALCLAAGRIVAQLATRTRTFLDFTASGESRFSLSPEAFVAGVVVVAVGLAAQVLPTLRAARQTVVGYRQERARALRSPWWQRAGVDFLLVALVTYGTVTIRRQNMSELLSVGEVALGDPFQDPLLFAVPFLTFLAATLLATRVLPLIVALLAWLASKSRAVGLVLAARHLSRTPRFYAAPTVLLVMTLGLSSFIASTADSLDGHLLDQIHYRAGAAMIIYPDVVAGDPASTAQHLAQPTDSIQMPEWSYVPLAEYLGVQGVRQAARVQRYWASPAGGISSRGGTFMGVDRASFAQVSVWREDFAVKSLGSLMNALALAENGVLAPRSFLEEHSLRVGDPLRLVVMTYGQENEFLFEIVGVFRLFPTWHPDWGPLFVGNLGYLFERIGTELPASVWLALESAASQRVRDDLLTLNPDAFVQQPLYSDIAVEQQRPERQGLFGVFSVGFVAAALLATLGFFLYAAFSLRRRTVELCTLKSLGLSFAQMSSYIAWEHIFLMLVGVGVGTMLGVTVSHWWIPYFRAGTDAWARVLPVEVRIGWRAMSGVYALFGLLLIAVLVLAVGASRRVRMSEAIKLMETA